MAEVAGENNELHRWIDASPLFDKVCASIGRSVAHKGQFPRDWPILNFFWSRTQQRQNLFLVQERNHDAQIRPVHRCWKINLLSRAGLLANDKKFSLLPNALIFPQGVYHPKVSIALLQPARS